MNEHILRDLGISWHHTAGCFFLECGGSTLNIVIGTDRSRVVLTDAPCTAGILAGAPGALPQRFRTLGASEVGRRLDERGVLQPVCQPVWLKLIN